MKHIGIAVALLLSALTLSAQEVMVGFWFGSPKVANRTEVNCLRFGLPGSSGGPVTMNGMEASIFCSSSDVMNGFQLTLAGASLARQARGVQVSLVNRVRENIDGAQVGVVNWSQNQADIQVGVVNYATGNAAFQVGLVNINPNGLLPFMILLNFGGLNDAN